MSRISKIFASACFLCLLASLGWANSVSNHVDEGNLTISENSQSGTLVVQLPVKDTVSGESLTYDLLPRLPDELSPILWLDASKLNRAETTWADKSNFGNHARMHGTAKGYPHVRRNAHNGLSLMHYCGANGAYHSFDEINNLRTAFWVIARKEEAWSSLLGHHSQYPFHFGSNNTLLHDFHASSFVKGGSIRISGNEGNASSLFPSSLSLISIRTSGNVTVSNFSHVLEYNGHYFNGDLGELILFDTPLTDSQISEVETYLSGKWALPLGYDPLPQPFVLSSSGELRTTRTFDHEELAVRKVRIRTTAASGESVDRTYRILVTDVVEDLDGDGVQDPFDEDIDGDSVNNVDELAYGTNPLDPNSLNRAPTNLRVLAELSVRENLPAGTAVGRVIADDADGDILSYTLQSNDFAVDEEGNLTTLRPLDHEATSSISVSISAADPRGGVISSQFQVEVRNDENDLDDDGIPDQSDPDRDGDGMGNELELANGSDPDDFSSLNHAPVDLNLTGNREVEENMPAGTIVGRVFANDEDGNDMLAYSLVTGDGDTHNSLFDLNSTTGELRTARFFDYETEGASISVRLQAKDDHNISTEHAFTIDLIDSDVFSPISLDANLMLWLDAMDGDTLDRGDFLGDLGSPEDGNETRFWADKSGHQHHAVRISGSPVYESAGLHGLPSIDTSGDKFEILDSNASFDAWDQMTVFYVHQWNPAGYWVMHLWKGTDRSVSSYHIQTMNLGASQGQGVWYGTGEWSSRLNGGPVTNGYDPIIIALTYDGTLETPTSEIYGNGLIRSGHGLSGDPVPIRLYSTPEHPVQFGNSNRFSEILIFNHAMSDENREKVEGYLGQKWGLLDHFPASHPYSNRGVTDDPLMILEGSAGRPVARLSELDADFNASWTYSLTDANESNDNELFSVFDPATFDPASLSNLALWLDAADSSTITADSDGNVSVWADKSGNESNATQSNASEKPKYVSSAINGFYALDFSSDKMVFTDIDMLGKTLLAVIKPDSVSGHAQVLSSSSLNVQLRISDGILKYASALPIYSNTTAQSSVNLAANEASVIAFILAEQMEFSTNGRHENSSSNRLSSGYSTYNQIGTQRLNAERFDGKMGEIIILNSTDSLSREKLEGYLAHKWGIVDQLPSSHIANTRHLLTNSNFDYETNASEYTVTIEATSDGVVQNQKDYRILLGDIYEDLDGDGIADHLDLDDDGDGFSDVEELAYPSDPRDPLSVANSPPHEINASGDLTVSETAEAGTVIGQFTATDPDGDANLAFSFAADSANSLIDQPSDLLAWFAFDEGVGNLARNWVAGGPDAQLLDGAQFSSSESKFGNSSLHLPIEHDAARLKIITPVQVGDRLISDPFSVTAWFKGLYDFSETRHFRSFFKGSEYTIHFQLSNSSGAVGMHLSGYGGGWRESDGNLLAEESAQDWQNIVVVFNGDDTRFFIDGKYRGRTDISPGGNVGIIGNHGSGGNQHFSEYLDDFRIYGKSLNETEVAKVYKDGIGDALFNLERNGTLRANAHTDYETDQNITLTISVFDHHGASLDKNFTVFITDQFEDLDGDGTADHLDPDIDGDELSNEDEIAYGSDPYDANSTNQPPASLLSQNTLSIVENAPAGGVVGTILATDLDGNETVSLEIIDNFSLGDLHPAMPAPAVWFDANHTQSLIFEEGNLTAWMDRSGNSRHATLETGTPEYNATAGPSGSPVVQFRRAGGDDKFTIDGKFLLRDHFYVVRSPSQSWDGYGGIIGHCDGRASNFLFSHGSDHLEYNQFPDEAWRNGSKIKMPFDLAPLNQFMILRVVVNTNQLIERDSWKLGDAHSFSASMDLSEAIVFSTRLPNDEAAGVETYLASKWGIEHHSAHGSFTLENGVLRTNRTYNYETDERNMTITVRATDDHGAYIDQNFSILLTNQLEDEDEDGVEDYTGTEHTAISELSVAQPLSIAENEPAGTIVGRVEAVDADGDRFHNYDIKFRPKADAFHPSLIEGITAWFDATDNSTLQNFEGTNKLKRWTNKVDREAILTPSEESNAPTSNGSLNGLNAIGFDSLDQIPKQLFASKQGANWNPMGENGSASGKLYDGSLYMVYRADKNAMSNFPFNFGWSSHFPWENDQIYWWFSDRRRNTFLANHGDKLMVGFEFSVTTGNQVFYRNGNPALTGPRTAPSNIGGAFLFPHNRSLDQLVEWTVGEMVVVRGVVQRDDHQRIEGYLAHKWGLADQLPSTHAYSPAGATFGNADDFFRIDENGTIRTQAPLDHEYDRNFSLTVRARDDFFAYSSEKNFTVLITNVAEADLDGDGIEDVLDNDWDGDGIPNDEEYNLISHDPWNPAAPHYLGRTLSIPENEPAGTIVGTLAKETGPALSFSLFGDETEQDNSEFSLNADGTLRAQIRYDYEVVTQRIIKVKISDAQEREWVQDFDIFITDVVEDLDGDNIQDPYDDDIDGDGVSNLDEARYRTNPWDAQSVNLPPSAIIPSSELSLLENQPVGAVVTQFTAEDAQGSDTVKLSMLPLYPDWIEPTVWLDANDPETLERASDGSVARWRNRVPGGRDFVQADAQAQPSIGSAHLNHYRVLEFDGSDYLHSEGDLHLGANFSIFMVAGIRQTNESDALLSYTSGCEGPDFHFISNGANEFYGRFSNDGMGRSRNFFLEPENGPALYELIFDHDNKIMRVLVNGLNAGITDYENPPGEHHILRLFANKHVDGFIGGTLGEVLVYPKALGGKARKNVEAYLGNKWGLEMSEPVPPYGFAMRADGTLITTKAFDYETDQNHTLSVRAMDDGNLTLDREFTVYLQNVVEDADEDGTEDHYDPDDDNDGVEDTLDPDDDNDHASDLAERYLGTNERNASSLPNYAENGFDLNRSEFPENLPVGQSVGKFYSFGQLGNISLRYFLVEGDGARDNQKFSIDSNGSLRPRQSFDYERVEPEFSVRVRADDQAGFYLERSFTLTLSNVFEDIDGDGTEDFYDDDIDGDGFSNETELAESTNPRDPYSSPMLPILKTISGYLDENGSIILRGRVNATGDARITDFGFVLSSSIVSRRNNTEDIWIRAEGRPTQFTLKVEKSPFEGDLYFRAWAKNVAGYGVGPVKKVIFSEEPPLWWGATEELSGGWKNSSWLGAFRAYEGGWIYHARLGWLYSSEAPKQSVWLWREKNGWLWTKSEVWPYLWSQNTADWLYLLPGKAGEQAKFYDFTIESYR